ncbi:MAG TPA: hypothetical protein PLW44_09715 [Chitinophagales bacterium]|nr:hypothetical protein [Chitinophagales bacterium]
MATTFFLATGLAFTTAFFAAGFTVFLATGLAFLATGLAVFLAVGVAFLTGFAAFLAAGLLFALAGLAAFLLSFPFDFAMFKNLAANLTKLFIVAIGE